MKKLFLIPLLCSMFLLIFSSCRKDDNETAQANLVGHWQPYKMTQSATLSTGPVSNTTDYTSCQQRSRVIFNANQSGSLITYNDENGACVKQGESSFTYTYTPDNNEISIKNPDGTTQIATVQSLTTSDLVAKTVSTFDFQGENVAVTTTIYARKAVD